MRVTTHAVSESVDILTKYFLIFIFFFFFRKVTLDSPLLNSVIAYIMIPAAQARESDDLRRAMSPFSLFLSSFSPAQRILGYVRPRKNKNREKKAWILDLVCLPGFLYRSTFLWVKTRSLPPWVLLFCLDCDNLFPSCEHPGSTSFFHSY